MKRRIFKTILYFIIFLAIFTAVAVFGGYIWLSFLVSIGLGVMLGGFL